MARVTWWRRTGWVSVSCRQCQVCGLSRNMLHPPSFHRHVPRGTSEFGSWQVWNLLWTSAAVAHQLQVSLRRWSLKPALPTTAVEEDGCRGVFVNSCQSNRASLTSPVDKIFHCRRKKKFPLNIWYFNCQSVKTLKTFFIFSIKISD